MRSYSKNIGWIILVSLALTGLGYLLDNDPSYDKLSTTLIEFSIVTVFFFTLVSGFFILIKRLTRSEISN